MHKDVGVFVSGAVGSGRRALLAALRERFPGAPALDLLPLQETDAPTVAILQALAAVGLREEPLGSDDEIFRAARRVARELEKKAKCPLLLRVPRDWGRIARQDELDDPTLSQADSLLRGLMETRAPVIVIADAFLDRRKVLLGAVREISLPLRRLTIQQIEPLGRWGVLEEHASALAEAPRYGSPVLLRLAVGALATGVPRARVFSALEAPDRARELAEPILAALARCPEGAAALGVLRELRVPVPLVNLCEALGLGSVEEALVTRCLGYGEVSYRVAAEVQAILRGNSAPNPASHRVLAGLHRALDGATSPQMLGQERIRHWAEKVHHLGAADSGTDSQWGEQQLPAPGFYWDRGRRQSERKEFLRAADTYRACLQKFPQDDYAWHYLGYNLEQGHGDPGEIEDAYRMAVRLAPYKSWWHGRLISFLIRTENFAEARGSWSAALPQLVQDPFGLCRDPILADQLHRWVASTWLDSNRPDDALAVLSSVDLSLRDDLPWLLDLKQQALLGQARLLWSNFLAQGSPDQDLRQRAFSLWEGMRLPHLQAPMPILEIMEDGLRMSWSLPLLLVQVDVPADPDAEIEWYAREHRSKRSIAGVGQDSLEELARWLREVHGE